MHIILRKIFINLFYSLGRDINTQVSKNSSERNFTKKLNGNNDEDTYTNGMFYIYS